jgi:hypothetical protein
LPRFDHRVRPHVEHITERIPSRLAGTENMAEYTQRVGPVGKCDGPPLEHPFAPTLHRHHVLDRATARVVALGPLSW